MSKPPSLHRVTGVVSDYEMGPVKGCAAEPAPAPLEINVAPATETAHEYVIRKARSRAEERGE